MKRYIKSTVKPISDEPKSVRIDWLLDSNARPRELARLADDPDYQVRSGVAYHKNTPIEILDKLADDDGSVVEAVAQNPNTPTATLEKIANRTDFWGKAAKELAMVVLVERPDVSTEMLQKIAREGYPEVSKAALKALRVRGL